MVCIDILYSETFFILFSLIFSQRQTLAQKPQENSSSHFPSPFSPSLELGSSDSTLSSSNSKSSVLSSTFSSSSSFPDETRDSSSNPPMTFSTLLNNDDESQLPSRILESNAQIDDRFSSPKEEKLSVTQKLDSDNEDKYDEEFIKSSLKDNENHQQSFEEDLEDQEQTEDLQSILGENDNKPDNLGFGYGLYFEDAAPECPPNLPHGHTQWRTGTRVVRATLPHVVS